MSLKRILKLLLAFVAGQGVSLITQLLVPPLFLHRYASGLEMYGEWLALTAAVSNLANLNFGVQNYANNQMTILYSRGETAAMRTVQSAAFLFISSVVALLGALGALSLVLPVGRWLGVRHLSQSEVAWTLFWMILQLGLQMLFGFFTNSYQVVGRLHRGVAWQNGQRVTAALLLAALIWMRSPFPVLAASQAVIYTLFLLLALGDMVWNERMLLPRLVLVGWQDFVGVIKPSAYFALLSLNTLLIWQGPVMLIERFLGPAAVAVFGLSRTVFSMSRQIISVLTYSIGQDVSHLSGKQDWLSLRRLYDLSERVILVAIPPLTVGTLLACPVLFTAWLHKRDIYDPVACIMMAAISAILAIKEHKWVFQWSTNRHVGLAKGGFTAYATMFLVSAPLVRSFGVNAFLVVWLATEVAMTVYILKLNRKLFPQEIEISFAPIVRFALLMLAAMGLSIGPVVWGLHWTLATVILVAMTGMILLTGVSYQLFGAREVHEVFLRKLSRRAGG